MKKIIVLGTGCSTCEQLHETTIQAVDELALDCEIEKITDFMRFAEFGVMIAPALVIDGAVVVAGRVPALAEIKKLLAEA